MVTSRQGHDSGDTDSSCTRLFTPSALLKHMCSPSQLKSLNFFSFLGNLISDYATLTSVSCPPIRASLLHLSHPMLIHTYSLYSPKCEIWRKHGIKQCSTDVTHFISTGCLRPLVTYGIVPL